MVSVLLVSKPVVPPWDDSGKNLVRDLASHLSDVDCHVMSRVGTEPLSSHCVMEPVYSVSGRLSPGLTQQLQVLKRLLKPDRQEIYHFFYAPNPRTSTVAKAVLAVKRRRTVHTICSFPAREEGIRSLFFADRNVVLSRHTLYRLSRAGVRNLIHIPPCVPLSAPVSDVRKRHACESLGLTRRPYVLFAGDFEFSNAGEVCLAALPAMLKQTDVDFVFAVRGKGAGSAVRKEQLQQAVARESWGDRVHFPSQAEDMPALIAAAVAQVLPVDTLFAKMDVPLVLLESLREGVPIVVSDFGPLPELLDEPVGLKIPVGDADALAEAVVRLVQDESLRDEMGQAGRELVAKTYSPAGMARRYEEIYNELGAGRHEKERQSDLLR
jgi:phosphatidylinositol alpha-1,6-mannosyltransferase